jgi:hypothetical protein
MLEYSKPLTHLGWLLFAMLAITVGMLMLWFTGGWDLI